ncbi:hypothetical protein [Jiangella muralis]|uniref:hypothetical protein n=1 Tax=Jiangella muralis TaxID=702383 RepID=UPI00069FB78C|nr:hypothetical protein [Jiangella muralis]
MDDEMIFVAGSRWFRIAVSETEALRALVTITMDGKYEWTFEEPVWRPISFGSGPGASYVWSARDLIRLPQAGSDEPVVEVSTDEDLIFVFEHSGGWVLVCETSIRRVLDGQQTARWELPGVVAHAVLRDEVLAVLDEDGKEVLLRFAGTDLASVPR